MKKFLLILGLIFPIISFAYQSPGIPQGFVNDFYGVLSSEEKAYLEDRISSFEKSTGNEMGVAVIATHGSDETIESYAYKLFKEWGIGKEGKDNGILLLVAVGDREVRIEVGYGLEGVLTDLTAAGIIDNEILPEFKEGNYNSGVENGVRAIINVLSDPSQAENYKNSNTNSGGFESNLSSTDKILFGFFIFGILGLFTLIGIVAKPLPISGFLYLFLIPFWALFPRIIVNSKVSLGLLIFYLAGYPLIHFFILQTEWFKKMEKKISSRIKSRKEGGHGGGGNSSGGSSGGFGGGSSGGGGASGSW